MDTSSLQKIGLTQGEIKVYIALLHLGTSSAGPIVKEARVARSKLYDILDRLAKKGMVSHAIQNGTRQFSVADPSRIMDFLQRKEDELKVQQKEIAKMLPLLRQEYTLQQVKQDAEVFDGLEGLKLVREKYLARMKKGDIIYFVGVPGSAYDRLEAYYRDWNESRIRKGIISYTIFTADAKNNFYVKEKLKHRYTHIRFLLKYLVAYSWMEIYDDTVVIAINHKKPMSIVIQNKFIAETYKQQFKLLWGMAHD